MTSPRYQPGDVLASRRKDNVTWQLRVGFDRNRTELIGIVPASSVPTIISALSDAERLELLGEPVTLDDREAP